MTRSSTLTVVIPRILDRAGRVNNESSLLAYVAGRGDIARRWHAGSSEQARLHSWQRAVLSLLHLDERHFPSAPITARGEQLDETCSDWLHAEPVHLVAGLNEVSLVPLPPEFALSREERDALSPALDRHLAAEGFVLRPVADGAWLIGTTRALDVNTVTAAFAQKHEWGVALPQGRDAGAVRRLMTELQMLLHVHPVNQARTARGVPAVNSLWLWGSGALGSTPLNAVATCMGDHAYLRGLSRLNGWPSPQTPTSAEDVVAASANASLLVFVTPENDLEALEAQWLSPLVEALRSGRFDRLEIVLDDWLLTLDRWRLRRFWRRALPVSAWSTV